MPYVRDGVFRVYIKGRAARLRWGSVSAFGSAPERENPALALPRVLRGLLRPLRGRLNKGQ